MASKRPAAGHDGERDRAVDRLRAAVAERSRARKPDDADEEPKPNPASRAPTPPKLRKPR